LATLNSLTSFANGLTIDANTNKTLPVTPTNADNTIFRFPQIFDPTELFYVHRSLVQKHAAFVEPQLPPAGQEASRIKAQLERYGPRQVRSGYMYLPDNETAYRLTWKGAFLMACKSIWPMSMIRGWLYRAQMKDVLRSVRQESIASVRIA
jgi:hypothetical protein